MKCRAAAVPRLPPRGRLGFTDSPVLHQIADAVENGKLVDDLVADLPAGVLTAMSYHPTIQPIVDYMQGLSLRDYVFDVAPLGQTTTAGSRGVLLQMLGGLPGATEKHTIEVEESGAADHYVRIRFDGRPVTHTPMIPRSDFQRYGSDLLGFVKPVIDDLLARLP